MAGLPPRPPPRARSPAPPAAAAAAAAVTAWGPVPMVPILDWHLHSGGAARAAASHHTLHRTVHRTPTIDHRTQNKPGRTEQADNKGLQGHGGVLTLGGGRRWRRPGIGRGCIVVLRDLRMLKSPTTARQHSKRGQREWWSGLVLGGQYMADSGKYRAGGCTSQSSQPASGPQRLYHIGDPRLYPTTHCY